MLESKNAKHEWTIKKTRKSKKEWVDREKEGILNKHINRMDNNKKEKKSMVDKYRAVWFRDKNC